MAITGPRIAAVNALRRLRRFTWFALFAIGGWVLVPTLAQAWGAPQVSNPWAEICSAAGASPAAPGDPALPAGHAGTGVHAEHCPLCSHQGAAPALAPSTALAWQAIDAADPLVEWAAPAPRTRPAWVTVQARAPPLPG